MKILFISLGCDKNLVDTEVMLGMLVQKGYSITDDEMEADAVVVNTCCFINDAKQESINTLLEMAELRKSGSIKALVAADNRVVIAANYWGKFKTTFQIIMVCLMIVNIESLNMLTQIIMWIAVILTIVSLIDYIVKNKGVLFDGKI